MYILYSSGNLVLWYTAISSEIYSQIKSLSDRNLYHMTIIITPGKVVFFLQPVCDDFWTKTYYGTSVMSMYVFMKKKTKKKKKPPKQDIS